MRLHASSALALTVLDDTLEHLDDPLHGKGGDRLLIEDLEALTNKSLHNFVELAHDLLVERRVDFYQERNCLFYNLLIL